MFDKISADFGHASILKSKHDSLPGKHYFLRKITSLRWTSRTSISRSQPCHSSERRVSTIRWLRCIPFKYLNERPMQFEIKSMLQHLIPMKEKSGRNSTGSPMPTQMVRIPVCCSTVGPVKVVSCDTPPPPPTPNSTHTHNFLGTHTIGELEWCGG